MDRNNRAAFLREIEPHSTDSHLRLIVLLLIYSFLVSSQATLGSCHVSCAPIYGARQL